jgi:hypothetical protein
MGFPVVIPTQVTISDQRVVFDKCNKKFRKMQAAQKDSKENLRVNVRRRSPLRNARFEN